MSRRTRNIVLLALDAVETQAKVRQYERAARALGLGVRASPDAGTLGVFPCSDSLAAEAAWLAHSHGIAAPDPLAVSIATNKALAYRFFEGRGFATLPWFLPLRRDDLRIDFDGPVIVKPEKGSGSFGMHPWGYRTFPSLRAFRGYLARERLEKRFFDNQMDPLPAVGRYLAMSYLGSSPVFSVAAAIGERRIAIVDSTMMRTRPGTVVVDWMLIGARHPRIGTMRRMIDALADAGLRRSFVYLQCVERGGRIFPIDVNLRPGTIWNALTRALGEPFFERALAFMLGLRKDLPVRLPARYVGVRRIFAAPVHGRRSVRFAPGCLPLIDELVYDARRPYDREHAWPMFAVPCRSPAEFERRARRVIAGTRIVSHGR